MNIERELAEVCLEQFDPEGISENRTAMREQLVSAIREYLESRRPKTADGTRWPATEYEQCGEPDGCYYCGSNLHKTSDCRRMDE